MLWTDVNKASIHKPVVNGKRGPESGKINASEVLSLDMGRDTVHFGAKEPGGPSDSPATLARKMLTQLYSDEFTHAKILKPALEALIQEVSKKPDPVAFARQLQVMGQSLHIEQQPDFPVQLAKSLNLTELKAFEQAMLPYKNIKTGTAPDQTLCNLMSAALMLNRQADASWDAIKTLPELFERASRGSLELYDPEMSYWNEDVRRNVRSLMLTVMSTYLNRKASPANAPDPPQGLDDFAKEVIADLKAVDGPVGDLPESARLVMNLLSFSKSKADYKARLAQLKQIEALNSEKQNAKFAYRDLFLFSRTGEDLEQCLSVYKDHQNQGGNVFLLSLVLFSSIGFSQPEPGATLRRISPGMRALETKYRDIEQQSVLEYVSSVKWNWTRFNVDLPEFLDVMTQMFLAMPPSVKISDFRKYIDTAITKTDDFNTLKIFPARLKAIMNDTAAETDSDIREAMLKILESSGDLDRMEVARDIFSLIKRKKGKMDGYSFNYAVRAFRDLLVDNRPGQILGTETVKQALANIPPALMTKITSASTDEYMLPNLIRIGMTGLRDKTLTPEGFPVYLASVISLAETVETDAFKRLYSNWTDLLAPGKSANGLPEEPGDRIQKVKAFVQAYRAKYPHKDQLPAMLQILLGVLRPLGKNEWEQYFDGIPEALSVLKPEQREKFMNSSLDISLTGSAFGTYRSKFPSVPVAGGRFSDLLKRVLEESLPIREKAARQNEARYDGRLAECFNLLLNRVSNMAEFENAMRSFKGLFATDGTDEARKQSLREMMTFVPAESREDMVAQGLEFLKADGNIVTLALFLLDPQVPKISIDLMKHVMTAAIQDVKAGKKPETLELAPEILSKLVYGPELNVYLAENTLRLPEKRTETFRVLASLSRLKSQFEADMQNLTPQQIQEQLKDNLDLMIKVMSPNKFLNYFMLNREKLSPWTLFQLYNHIEYNGGRQVGLDLLPELLATLTLYAEMGRKKVALKDSKQFNLNNYINMSTGALTSLYFFINHDKTNITINNIDGIVFNNWAKVGALGLSFTKWQYDAMKRWKGQGPAQKPALMEQSGFFEPLPARESDKTYHGGFYRYNPKTGVSIEMRRAYIVISKPGAGSLVIRNSSQVFGRDLFKEPAYFHPDKVYTGADNLLDPAELIMGPEEGPYKNGYMGIMGKYLNQEKSQVKNHQKIQALLEAFDEEMEPYIAWKCGFKGGKPPEGFKEILQSALLSSKSDGAMTPFGKKKHIKAAWVNRFGLPFAVKSLNVTDPKIQAELAFYINVLEKRATITSPADYTTKMPNLLAFLQEGLANNMELVLTE